MLKYLNVSAKSILTSKRNIKSYFYSKLKPKYNAVWKTEIFNDRPGKQYGNKLRTYRLFKNIFAFESYLDLDNFNRSILIRFRISAHNLEIEKGRHKSNQIKKFYLKSVHFITLQHKLSRAFQTDMDNKLHKLNTAQ
jgi:hypothetical protein